MGLERVQFAMLSLEGPDLYASAGGLGVRATELCQCLANLGFPTHLFFVGDPELPARETRFQGNLVLHRWGQWLSARHPRGVYDGEAEKVADYASSLPPWLVENLVAPAAEKGLSTVFLAEEWQTVPAVLNLGRLLAERGLEHHALVLWNANNLFGFDGVAAGGGLDHGQSLHETPHVAMGRQPDGGPQRDPRSLAGAGSRGPDPGPARDLPRPAADQGRSLRSRQALGHGHAGPG
jgi:hypothetical protein